MSSYVPISNFGPNCKSPMSNPLTYCAVTPLDSNFNHTAGDQFGPYSSQCQRFMSQYCANNWDGVCEYVSRNVYSQSPNTVQQCDRRINGVCMGPGLGSATSLGEILVRNTAAEKYLDKMSSNCVRRYEPFDPTVADSPLISYWESNCNANYACVPIYSVDPKTIDNDVVMNKILSKPSIAMDVLINIYNNARNSKKLHELKGTKLYNYFMSPNFQSVINAGKVLSKAQVLQASYPYARCN